MFLKSCLVRAVIAMNVPTAAKDLKRRKPLQKSPAWQSLLKSRGELDTSHNAGIFRWQKSEWPLGRKKKKQKKSHLWE